MALKILKWIALAHVAAGILLPVLWFVDAAHPIMLSLIYGDRAVDLPAAQIVFWIAILGPTIASWGVLFFALLCQFECTPSRVVWNSLLAALLVWAPLDSALCFMNGIYVGALMNAVVVAIIVMLLLKVRPT